MLALNERKSPVPGSYRTVGTGRAPSAPPAEGGPARPDDLSGTWDVRSSRVKASTGWLAESGAEFSAGAGRSGYAHLKHYTAQFCTWGEGRPLVLVPGLAGGFELLGPLARLLARDFQVISYHLRGEDDCFALRRRFGLADLVEDL